MSNLHAFDKSALFNNDRLTFLTFRVGDVKFLSYELGFLGKKKFKNYPYYSYGSAYLANKRTTKRESLEGSSSNQGVTCAIMAAKGGVLLPLLKTRGLMALGALSIGITAIGEAPWFGANSDRLADPTLLAYEVGLIYHFEHMVTKLSFYDTNLEFLDGNILFSFGVVF
jgi:hypothetical protein